MQTCLVRFFVAALPVFPLCVFAQLQWTQVPSPTTSTLRAVSFGDSLAGIAVGDNATIIRTTDGGLTWATVQSGTGVTLRAVKMTDSLNGVAVGDAGTILLSSDGGASWQQRHNNVGVDFYTVEMAGRYAGWIGGMSSNQVLHTTDRWTSWSFQTTEMLSVLHISCWNNLLCLANDLSYLNRTTNGGQTWMSVGYAPGVGNTQLLDTNTSIGSGAFIHSGTLLRSVDGGYSWNVQYYTGSGNYIHDVKVHQSGAGVAVGENGSLFHTTDAGVSWTASESAVTEPLYGCTATSDFLLAVGAGGLILRAVDSVLATVENGQPDVETRFSIDQNYPNPFNPSTHLRFRLSTEALITLEVYDVLGRVRATVLSGRFPAGEHTVKWDAQGLPSGTYFCRLNAQSISNGSVSVGLRKLTLVK